MASRVVISQAEPATALTVLTFFSDASDRFADRPALRCGDQTLSFAALESRANDIARGLVAQGVKPGSLVGLFLSRSIETVAAILGVLKAGAAYVPFDPAYPAAQLQFILDDSAPSVVLTRAAMRTRPAATIFEGRTTLDLDRDFPAIDGRFESPAIAPGDRAYVMYTSGSTGRPKGVQVPHQAITRLVIDNDFADFGPDEVILHLAPLAFDASTFELWAALLHGGCLAIVPQAQPSLDEIAAAIKRHQVTTCWLTAGLFHLMVDHQLAALGGLRQLLAGGDVLSVAHVDKLLAAYPHIRLINGYGPTENTTFSCCHTITANREPGPIPIGRSIRHSEALILDAAMQTVADGDIGELYVGGLGLAIGYLNRPELDAERFLPHPLDSTPGARVYRTGDLVRRRRDGVIEFHGRADRQVKINGKRVELDEIEAAIRRSGLVRDAAVLSWEPVAGDRRVAGFVTASASQPLSVEALRDFLRRELPDYMQPANLTVLAEFPLSPTGKVDRARLPLPVTKVASTVMPLPANALEATVMKVWREVLGSDAITVDDNFFDIGGSSLQMLKVHAALQPLLPKPVSIIDLFTYPRIRLLTAWLNQNLAASPVTAMTAQERARRQQAALARARPQSR